MKVHSMLHALLWNIGIDAYLILVNIGGIEREMRHLLWRAYYNV